MEHAAAWNRCVPLTGALAHRILPSYRENNAWPKIEMKREHVTKTFAAPKPKP